MPSPPASPPLLGSLPTGRMAPIFANYLAVLQADATLQSAHVTVTTYMHGYDESGAVKPEPDDAELPYIRVMFLGGGAKWETEHTHMLDFNVALHLFTLGPNQDDMLNLIEATIRAIYPQEQVARDAVFASFRQLPGLQGFKITGGLADFSPIGHGARGLKSIMKMSCKISLNT